MSELSAPGAGPSVLYGRTREVGAIHTLVANARNGISGALLIEGDPGVGKTALVDEAMRGLNAVRVLRISGFEVEAAFAYAALQRLGGPLKEYSAGIPELQQGALRVAVGLGAGDPPHRALVGLGVLSLLSHAGDDLPTVCVVDDAHNLDSESIEVLGFVARRLSAECPSTWPRRCSRSHRVPVAWCRTATGREGLRGPRGAGRHA